MKVEYDFSNGVRAKHDRAYRAGHTVLRQRFPDSDAVNKALRSLVSHD